MRKLRLALVIVALLAMTGAGVWLAVNWMSRRQTEEALARQAEEIAAHRQAQRDEPPVTPPVCTERGTSARFAGRSRDRLDNELDGLPGSAPRRPLHRRTDSHRLDGAAAGYAQPS
jgi:hypothetical protein